MSPHHYLLFWVVSAGIFLLPGALLARRSSLLWTRIGPGERILPAFLLSAGVYGAVYLAAMALRPTMGFAVAAFAILTAGLLAWNLTDLLPRNQGDGRRSDQKLLDTGEYGGARTWLWILPVLLFGWIAMMVQGGSLGFTHDSLDFAAYVHRMLLTGRIDIASAAYAPSTIMAPDPRRGAFHLAAAILCRLARVSPVEMWRVFPTFLIPLTLWIFYTAFRRILQSSAVALASLLFFVMANFFTGDHFINNLAYASRLGWVYSWVGLWAVALYLDQDRRDNTPPDDWSPRPATTRASGRAALALAVACAPILLGIHILSAAQYLISLGAFTWVWALARREPRPLRRALWYLPFVSAAALAPFLFLKLKQSYSTANPLFDHAQGLLYVVGKWAVLGPGALAAWFGWPGLLGILLALPLCLRWRRDRTQAFLVGSTLIPFLIVLNPVAMRVIEGARVHSLLFRVLFVVPYFQVLGWYSVWAIRRLRHPGSARRLVAPVFFALVAVMFLGLHFRQARRIWKTPPAFQAGLRELPALESALEAIDACDAQPQVVVSDPITSYTIPAYTHHYAMTPFNQHSSPSDDRAIERIQDSQSILSAYVPIQETVRLLRKYQATYVLVNQSFPRYQQEYYTLISPLAYPRQRQKFLGRPGLFDLLYNQDGMLIFRFRDPGTTVPSDSLDLPNPFRALTASEAAGRSREEIAREFTAVPYAGASPPGLELLAWKPDSLVYHRGEPLVTWGYWRRTEGPIVLPVEAFLRFEAPFPDRLFDHPILGRIYRIWYESRHHVTYRFGREFDPLASVYPSYLWEPGAVYKDWFYLYSPAHASPGEYTVRLRLYPLPFVSNVRLADLFTLHDSLDGLVVGKIRLE